MVLCIVTVQTIIIVLLLAKRWIGKDDMFLFNHSGHIVHCDIVTGRQKKLVQYCTVQYCRVLYCRCRCVALVVTTCFLHNN